MGLGEKKELVRGYIFQGLKTAVAFRVCAITKHQYYYKNKKTKQGRGPSTTTFYTDNCGQKFAISNDVIIEEIKQVHQDPDTDYGYQKIETLLQIKGYNINHKKVYRLMKDAQLLQEKHRKPSKTRVKYRKVFPSQPFEVLEMDIKFVWVEEHKMHCYVLTTIDTFTRVVLHWKVAYSIKKQDVKQAWEHIIINHLQPNNCLEKVSTRASTYFKSCCKIVALSKRIIIWTEKNICWLKWNLGSKAESRSGHFVIKQELN